MNNVCLLSIFLLVHMVFSDNTVLYDNKEEHQKISNPVDSLQSCHVYNTEHFTRRQFTNIQSQMQLSSFHLLQLVIKHFKYLLPIVNKIQYSELKNRFYMIVNFQQAFEFAPLTDNQYPDNNACFPVVAMRQKKVIYL